MKPFVRRAPWLALLVLASACAGLRGEEVIPPDVQIVNLVPLSATLFEQEMRVDLRIINPNDFDLPLDGMTFELTVNGDRVARGTSSDSVTIPRLGDGVMEVITRTSSIAIVRQMLNPPPGGTYRYEIRGFVFLKGFGQRKVPFERTGKLPTLDPTAPAPTV